MYAGGHEPGRWACARLMFFVWGHISSAFGRMEELCHTPPACGHLPYLRGGRSGNICEDGERLACGFGESTCF